METGVLNAPGSGWSRLAARVVAELPAAEIDGVWVFPSLRREGREWGTALVSRIDGELPERRRIYTARFVHTLKGKERGKFEAVIEEVGSGPLATLEQLLAGIHRRLDEAAEGPKFVAPADWLPPPPPEAADAAGQG
jgi:hypothetical protein